MSAHRLYIGTTSVLPASAHMVPQVYILAVDLRSYVRINHTILHTHTVYTYHLEIIVLNTLEVWHPVKQEYAVY